MADVFTRMADTIDTMATKLGAETLSVTAPGGSAQNVSGHVQDDQDLSQDDEQGRSILKGFMFSVNRASYVATIGALPVEQTEVVRNSETYYVKRVSFDQAFVMLECVLLEEVESRASFGVVAGV